MTDPWSVLGVARDAPEEEVKRAYRRLAMRYHPDHNGGDATAEAKFKEAKDAYDQIRNPPPPHFEWQTGPAPWDAAFTDIFSMFRNQPRQRNRDYHAECRITLEDAFTGREIVLTLQTPAGARDIPVTVPRGVDTGMKIRVPQGGDHGNPAFTPGDLYLVVQIQPHARFQRRGNDLLVTRPIDALDLLVGTSLSLLTIDGQTLDARVPASFNPRQYLRVAGHGMPIVGGQGRGDLLVELTVDYPALNARQTELLHAVIAARGP